MTYEEFLKAACPPLDLEWRKYRRRSARHRVEERMRELGLVGYGAYLERLRADPSEADGLAERMLVTVSRFFRERQRWEVLAQSVLPRLLEETAEGTPLRIWSAGCCGGEEPYTLALLWLDALQPRFPGHALEILATDIDPASLARARLARYAAGSLAEVPKETRRRHFERHGELWQLSPQVAALVSFEVHNLMAEPPRGNRDLVCCRYLAFTYYRGRRLREAALHLWQALRPGGALMIGRKEDLRGEPGFVPWPEAPGVFRKSAVPFVPRG